LKGIGDGNLNKVLKIGGSKRTKAIDGEPGKLLDACEGARKNRTEPDWTNYCKRFELLKDFIEKYKIMKDCG